MSSLIDEAVRIVQLAIDFDTRHQYADAVVNYDAALKIFARARDALAENDPVSAVTVAQKMEEYSGRLKVLREALASNPFAAPVVAPAPLSLTMAAPIPMGGAAPIHQQPPAANAPPAYIPPPQVVVAPYGGGYQEMPPPRGNPVPAPIEYPAHLKPQAQLPVTTSPAAAARSNSPNANKIVKSKEQEFMGHKNKIKLVVSMPRYAERLRPGEVVHLDVMLDNPTSCVVSSIKVNLMRNTLRATLEGPPKTDTSKVKGDEYYQGGRFPMKEEKYEGVLEFALPSDIPSSVIHDRDLATAYFLSYDIIVKAVVKWHDDVELVFPIIVTARL